MGPKKKTSAERYKVRVSSHAVQHINEITGYIAFIEQQPANAVKVGDALWYTIDRISRNPLAFRECEEMPTRNKMYRRATCFSWSVIYRVNENDILILGVIHHSRKPAKIRRLRKIK